MPGAGGAGGVYRVVYGVCRVYEVQHTNHGACGSHRHHALDGVGIYHVCMYVCMYVYTGIALKMNMCMRAEANRECKKKKKKKKKKKGEWEVTCVCVCVCA